jgi:hypothetical protein
MNRRARMAALSVVIVALFAAHGAEAATLGQTGSTPGCGGGVYTEIQVSTAGPPSYVVPADGTISSWSTLGNADTDDQLQLKVFRPTATPNSYLVVGVSTVQPITANVLNGPFPASIAVKAGDLLGMRVAAGTSPPCTFNTGVSGDTVREILPDNSAVGDTVGTTGPLNVRRVNLSATFEPATSPPAASCVVPKLEGKRLKRAKRSLRNSDCSIGRVKGEKGGKVKKQNPKPGTTLPAGAKVNVTLG